MLPSRPRPRATNVEVWTPIEGMSSRTGGEPGRIGPRSTVLVRGEAGARAGATELAAGAERADRGVGAVVAAGVGDAGAASRAGGCGGPAEWNPRVRTIPA